MIVLEAQWDWRALTVGGVGNPIKNAFAALPRAIAANFPGLDRTKVYVVGYEEAARTTLYRYIITPTNPLTVP